MRGGVPGLLREKTRKPSLPPFVAGALVDFMVELTLTKPPGEAELCPRWCG